MAESKGWIKLHRKIQDCFIWTDKPYDKARAWVDLLLLATHSDKKLMIDGKPLVIPRGSYMTSREKLATKWGWSVGKVDRFLKTLETEEMITTNRTPKGTVVTIVNYNEYQVVDIQNDTTDSTTDNTSDNTPDGTIIDTSDNTLDSTQNKNVKNDKECIKNEKNNINNIICSEPKEELASEPHVISLTLNDKSEYLIYQKDIDEWKELYPSVDVIQQLRNMKGWCNSNPTKRKTRRGIKRFINSWLSKEQDKPKRYDNNSFMANTTNDCENKKQERQ